MEQAGRDNFIDGQAADKLIAAHDGDVALLYIYLARSGGEEDLEQAAHALCRTLGELTAAREKLGRMGLLPLGARPASPAPVRTAPEALRGSEPPEPRLPEYRAEEIARRSKEDGAFSVILSEAVKVVGHALSGSDMKLLFGIYDYLALPPEVILELLNYCAEVCAERYGDRRRPSARFIEKEAYIWANREILTLEQAEDYIRLQKDRRSLMGRVKAALGIRDRALTATEERYLSSWLDMGYGEEALAIAYDRTVTNTGSLKWSYMNKIVSSWYDKKLFTPQEIEAGDSRRRKAAAPAAREGGQPVNLEEMRSFLGK